MARYSVNNYTVETLLSNIKSGNIAIPEMQRLFVWDSSKATPHKHQKLHYTIGAQ